MLRKRLIFGLIYSDGYFTQSRNFRLQKVGDINWLEKNYKFQDISFSLDELFIVDASRTVRDQQKFAKTLKTIANNVFIPITAGGGIKCVNDADILFENGADKIVINTSLIEFPELVNTITNKYGVQSVVAGIDYKIKNNEIIVLICNASKEIEYSLLDYVKYIESMGVGEILLTAIDKDGTGFGYDIETINLIGHHVNVPLLIMGGAGNQTHLKDGLANENVSGVVTANLFNFIGQSLPNARDYLIDQKINIANWERKVL